jgi:homoserine O-acetyltransferase
VIVSRKDHMVNPSPALHFAEIAGARTLILESDCGHLAAFCEANAVASAVSQFLAER